LETFWEVKKMATYFGQYKGATGGLLPSGISQEMGKAGQYLAAGMSGLGAGIGKRLKKYKEDKERKEILTERAEFLADQKDQENDSLFQNRQITLDEMLNRGEEIDKFRSKINDSSTSQLTAMVANEMLEYERKGRELDRQVKRNQLDAYDREVNRDQAVAELFGDYKQGANEKVRTDIYSTIPAEYESVPYAAGEGFVGPAPEGVFDPRFDKTPLQQMMENFEAEQPMLGPLNSEYNLMGEKELTQFQIKEVIDSKKRAIDDLSKANTKTVNYNYSEEQKELAKKQGVNLPSTSYVEPFAKTALVRLKQDIANLEKDMVNNLNGLEITDETKQLLQMYRQGTENEDGSLDPVVIKEPIETPPIKEMGKQWTETKQGEMISPERTKTTTVMRPKTAQERSAMLEGMIGQRAEDLGVQGIKDITELTKSVKPELVELGGFKYVVSSKTGAFQLLPGQDQKGATPEQIKAMKALGYQPKTATLTLGNGITMQMEVPPQKDGSNRTEGQAQAFLHNGLMNDSEDIIQKIKQEESFDATTLTGSFELYHNIELARSPEAKQYAAAMNKWIESYLRYVSGAAIAEHEYKGARSQFFPVVGDSEENIDIKHQRRVKTMNLLKEVSGGGSINELVNFSDNLVDLQTGKAAPISLFRTSDPDEAFQMAKEKGMKAGQKVKYYDPETATFKTIVLK
tara:strand:+ start:1517 stop:3577 length:2061 start_codon:yes stop_codon:yes gene_type:complete